MLKLGHYTKRSNETFFKYLAPYFPIYPYEPEMDSSCGEDAFYTLTGKNFTKKQRKRYNGVVSDRQMIDLLRKNGYTVVPLSVARVSNGNKATFLSNKIKDKHVLLNKQLMFKLEASWCIITNNSYNHNRIWENVHLTEFINRPIITSYIIWHKKWA